MPVHGQGLCFMNFIFPGFISTGTSTQRVLNKCLLTGFNILPVVEVQFNSANFKLEECHLAAYLKFSNL